MLWILADFDRIYDLEGDGIDDRHRCLIAVWYVDQVLRASNRRAEHACTGSGVDVLVERAALSGMGRL